MAKTKKRKHIAKRMSNAHQAVSEHITRSTPVSVARGSVLTMGGQRLQNIVFSAMVGLGCWGLACFFIFFYSEEPNHYLYGGIMAVTALIWSLIAVRKWSMYRQHA